MGSDHVIDGSSRQCAHADHQHRKDHRLLALLMGDCQVEDILKVIRQTMRPGIVRPVHGFSPTRQGDGSFEAGFMCRMAALAK